MALITREIPAVVAGVSQQTHAKRSDGHVSEAINMDLSPVHGAISRPGSVPIMGTSPLSIPSGNVQATQPAGPLSLVH